MVYCLPPSGDDGLETAQQPVCRTSDNNDECATYCETECDALHPEAPSFLDNPIGATADVMSNLVADALGIDVNKMKEGFRWFIRIIVGIVVAMVVLTILKYMIRFYNFIKPKKKKRIKLEED